MTVYNAIGVISVGELQITVLPKIPIDHFLYLANKSRIFPRVEEQITSITESKSLIELIAYWFVKSSEKLLRGELLKGYNEISDTLDIVRGRIQIFQTANAFYRGNIKVFCEYEDFNTDIAINRVIKAAAEIVAAASLYDFKIRHRAKAILSRMEDVGGLQYNDLRCQIDRLTYHYHNVLTFAKYIITGSGVEIAHGLKHAWTFLIRTPEIIEAGIREVLSAELQDLWTIKKSRIQLEDSRMTLTPDLIFNSGTAMGDIKYKLTNKDWSRSDLYQIVTFTAGYKSKIGMLIGFNKSEEITLPVSLKVGDMSFNYFFWDARSKIEPSDSGKILASGVHDWLKTQFINTSIADAA